jgi:hypothetical protein
MRVSSSGSVGVLCLRISRQGGGLLRVCLVRFCGWTFFSLRPDDPLSRFFDPLSCLRQLFTHRVFSCWGLVGGFCRKFSLEGRSAMLFP